MYLFWFTHFPEAIDLSFILSTMLVYIVLFSDTIWNKTYCVNTITNVIFI